MFCTFMFRFLEMNALWTFYSVMEHVITNVRATIFSPYKAHKNRLSGDK